MGLSATVVPYMAATSWYRSYLDARLAMRGTPPDVADTEAVLRANRSVLTSAKALCRAIVAGAHGQPPMTLTVPISGGASAVRREDATEWRLSDHGRWQHLHLGAIQAAYGSSPLYAHIMDTLRPVIDRPVTSGVSLFAQLTHAIHRIVLRHLNIDENIDALREMITARQDFASALRYEYSRDVIEYLSIFDVIFRKGEDAIFALLPTLQQG